MKKLFMPFLVLGALLLIVAVLFFNKKTPQKQNNPLSPPPVIQQKQVVSPIDKADQRVTKKPFGIHITPKNSPIQPEKFTGYHTGTDFETFTEEANVDIPFYAICEGKILQKRSARGYGGVLVHSCEINNQIVTVVYGHGKLTSISKNVGDSLSQGEKIGFLGQPPKDTDGERKHLHLGIHKSTGIDIRGYVQMESELVNWLDWQKLN